MSERSRNILKEVVVGNFIKSDGNTTLEGSINITTAPSEQMNIYTSPGVSGITVSEFVSSGSSTYMGIGENSIGQGVADIYSESLTVPTIGHAVGLRLDPGNVLGFSIFGACLIDNRAIPKGLELIDSDGNHITNFSGLTDGSYTPKKYVVDNFPQKLTATPTLDFGNTLAQSHTDLTVSVSGAVINDPVVVGPPNTAVLSGTSYFAWVSNTNVVTVRFNNYSSTSKDPGSGAFKIIVLK